MLRKFKTPKTIFIGGQGNIKRIAIGGDAPVTVQTMWKEEIASLDGDDSALTELIKKINVLKSLGCDILRFAVPDMKSAAALVQIQERHAACCGHSL